VSPSSPQMGTRSPRGTTAAAASASLADLEQHYELPTDPAGLEARLRGGPNGVVGEQTDSRPRTDAQRGAVPTLAPEFSGSRRGRPRRTRPVSEPAAPSGS
jgi:hypothetical protein